MKGCFIAFEGANGVGKSTVIKQVYNKLLNEKVDVFKTKEPSDSKIGLLSREIADEISGKALACLVAADRFLHVENVIMPEIRNGKIVLCDRNILSAYVFNKMDGISFEYTEMLYDGLLYPDIIILFDASPQIVHNRLMLRSNLTRYEKEMIGFEQEVINESVNFLMSKNIKIIRVSTEKAEEETVVETYNIVRQYI